ncbi:unnamed protein product [Tilletia caries]|uniref:WD repeat domain-containing protein 83 n=2 Tax=Tilletia TaxID=13289 RepID=A0A8X7MU04_9BASI|nr:hypothetical protein CF336_g3268 [Tilletia laevis]KAE8248459.1 hypothetical protein A4X06_0g3698 [Tilletia controversa]KAE8262268.1 hypothetical protein A4X03_0g2591 [Tilletia caries]CAD6888413.1 unnamed protein product [Tilletia caries]CAD6911438.1 unnamed protein product [Tilletia caries]
MPPLPGAEWRRPERRKVSASTGEAQDDDEGHGANAVKFLHSFAAHKAAINVARWNSLGKYILTASSDRSVNLWNAASGPPCIRSYSGHSHDVHALEIAPDNASFASGGEDKNVLVWDVASANILHRFNQHQGRINDVRFAGAAGGELGHAAGTGLGHSVLFTAGFDTVTRAYDLRAKNYKPIMEMKDATDSITTLSISKSAIFTGSADGIVRSYDLRKGELREDVFATPIVSLSPNRNRSLLLVSTLDHTHRILDLSDGTVLQTLKGHRNSSYRCHSVFSSDEASVLAGDETGILWKWDILTGDGEPIKPDQVLSTKTAYGDRKATGADKDQRAIQIASDVAHARSVLWTEVSPAQNSTLCLTAGADAVLKIWEL